MARPFEKAAANVLKIVTTLEMVQYDLATQKVQNMLLKASCPPGIWRTTRARTEEEPGAEFDFCCRLMKRD